MIKHNHQSVFHVRLVVCQTNLTQHTQNIPKPRWSDTSTWSAGFASGNSHPKGNADSKAGAKAKNSSADPISGPFESRMNTSMWRGFSIKTLRGYTSYDIVHCEVELLWTCYVEMLNCPQNAKSTTNSWKLHKMAFARPIKIPKGLLCLSSIINILYRISDSGEHINV